MEPSPKRKGRCRCKAPSAPHPRGPCDHRYEDHPHARVHEGALGERTVRKDQGGPLAEQLELLTGLEFECLGTCGKPIRANEFLGYLHEGGLADVTGRKWWVWVRCPDCGYDTAWWKIPVQVEKLRLARVEVAA